MTSTIKNQKEALRTIWKSKFQIAAEDRLQASGKICVFLSESSVIRHAAHIALFAGTEREVDLGFLWAKRPQRCFYPKTDPKNQKLAFYQVKALGDLTPAFAGIREPDPTKSEPLTLWEDTDVILVPGISFDRKGGRLGTGKGYYDRFLATLPKKLTKWGICFAGQLSPDPIPHESTDIRMDGIVTEEGLIITA